jgi:hypothetical protein
LKRYNERVIPDNENKSRRNNSGSLPLMAIDEDASIKQAADIAKKADVAV